MNLLFAVAAFNFLIKPVFCEDVAFSYSDSTGPDHWARLSPNYALCATGRSQSPVNLSSIPVHLNPNLKALDIHFTDSVNATLVNTGYHVELRYNGGGGGSLVLHGTIYTLSQLHWHAPSEHFSNSFTCELHLPFKSPHNSMVVVAIMFRFGQSDPIIAELEQELSRLSKRSPSQHPPEVALGNNNIRHIQNLLREFTNVDRYYTYEGSLTTPPCTEDVTWIVIEKFRTISMDQVETLQRPLDNGSTKNARPMQPLNGRKIETYQSHSISPSPM
ncbi:unnamed protein product [Cuscuta epithymum]|uniref:Alpha-carbonic anhydrase domain-containing protein n=1 Tax=Cuscuta epithymum TaxID=186058 RepID=A0AAV0CJ37_9ASTE|nr:unnamed protein product [Cuscuta epithymum]